MRLNPTPAYAHQTETTSFILSHPRCLITSDPGTGKTRSVLDAHSHLESTTLVIAPLSILEAAWVDDITFPPAYIESDGVLGDLNDDGIINILDVIIMVNIILGTEPESALADVNGDGNIDVLDIIHIVNIILNN